MSEAIDHARSFYEMFMESQFWSAERLLAHQRAQLAELFRHAKRNVPFYESRLDAVIRPDGGFDWDRWSEIPIVTRRDMREHRYDMLARLLPKGHGPTGTVTTSGSTGLSISITTSAFFRFPHSAAVWRCQQWNAVDWSQTLCSREAVPAGQGIWPEGTLSGKWGPTWLDTPRGEVWKISRDETSAHTLEFVARRGARYFNGSPKTTHALALEAERMGLKLELDAVMAQGERVDEAARETIRRVFGARVVEHYSSKEGGQMAHPCPHGKLHINAESVLIEILDADGRPCRPGQSGRVVITPFYNYAHPLIRYEQGDIAVVGASCSCGRTLPVLDEVTGRTQALFRHPDGRTISRLFSWQHRKVLGCDFWQIAQVGPNDYEIRYVPLPGIEGDKDAILAAFRSTYFDDAKVKFVEMTSLPLTAAGKFIEYVNEFSSG